MDRRELIERLRALQPQEGKCVDVEMAHEEADRLLVEYLNDDELAKEFWKVPRWYA